MELVPSAKWKPKCEAGSARSRSFAASLCELRPYTQKVIVMLGFSAHPFTTSQRLLFWFAFAGTVSGASVAGSHFFLIVDSVRATSAAPPSTNTVLRDIVSTGRLADLRWPDFSDYHRHAQNFCEP